MKRPNREDYKDDISYFRYVEDLNKYIDYLESALKQKRIVVAGYGTDNVYPEALMHQTFPNIEIITKDNKELIKEKLTIKELPTLIDITHLKPLTRRERRKNKTK